MNNSTENSGKSWAPTIAKIAFLAVTFGLLVTVIYFLRDVLHAIVLGIFFAIILMPTYRRIHGMIKDYSDKALAKRKTPPKEMIADPEGFDKQRQYKCRFTASLVLVVLFFCVVAVPVCLFVSNVARQGIKAIPNAVSWVENEMPEQAKELYQKYSEKEPYSKIIVHSLKFCEEYGLLLFIDENGDKEVLPEDGIKEEENSSNADITGNYSVKLGARVSENLTAFISKISIYTLNWLRSSILGILAEVGWMIFNFFIMLFVMFHIFLDGASIFNYLQNISPLSNEAQAHIFTRIKNVSRAIFFSIFGTAVIQGVLSMVIFWIVDIPALFWGFMLGICSIVPFVGTGLIWVPVTVFLFLTGHPGKAVFVLLACGGLVSNIDSFIRPILMKKGGKTGMSYMVLFFSLLGGLRTFGLAGLIYGPLITGICGICLMIYSTQFKERNSLPENVIKEDLNP